MKLPVTGTPLGRLRITGLLEGLSWLLLLFVAMPLKYIAGKPETVRYVGWVHGLLFILYLVLLLSVWSQKKWKLKTLLIGGVAALLPFGTWVFDSQLKKYESIR